MSGHYCEGKMAMHDAGWVAKREIGTREMTEMELPTVIDSLSKGLSGTIERSHGVSCTHMR